MEPQIVSTPQGRKSRRQVAHRVKSKKNLEQFYREHPEAALPSTSPSVIFQRVGMHFLPGFSAGFAEADRRANLQQQADTRRDADKMKKRRLESRNSRLATNAHFNQIMELGRKKWHIRDRVSMKRCHLQVFRDEGYFSQNLHGL